MEIGWLKNHLTPFRGCCQEFTCDHTINRSMFQAGPLPRERKEKCRGNTDVRYACV